MEAQRWARAGRASESCTEGKDLTRFQDRRTLRRGVVMLCLGEAPTLTKNWAGACACEVLFAEEMFSRTFIYYTGEQSA